MTLVVCPGCRRHVRERLCVFCGAARGIAILAVVASGCSEREVAAVYGGPPVPASSPAPPGPTVSASSAPVAASAELVKKHVAARDPTRGYELRAHQTDAPLLPLAGLELWRVEVVIPDGWTHACWVDAGVAACADDAGALERLARAHQLGKEPSKLSDVQWIDLGRYVTDGIVVASGAAAQKLLSDLPPDLAAKVAAPSVSRPAAGGVELRLHYVAVANDAGPQALVERRISIGPDGAVAQKDQRLHPKP
jgi:hypothetical protein